MAALFKFPGVAFITGAGGTGMYLQSVRRASDHHRPQIRITYNMRITGIGAAVAKGFARSGCARIAITDINKGALERTRDAILDINPRAQVTSRDGDISDEKFVDSLARDIARAFSRLDYAVNCAGILGKGLRSHETPVSAFDHINGVNYKGTWLSSRAAISQMLRQQPLPEYPQLRGAIVNIASQLGIVARPDEGGSFAPSLSVDMIQND